MASFEWNKIIASALTAVIVAMVCGILASQIIGTNELAKPVFMVAGAAPAATTPAAQAAPAKLAPIGPLLAKADPKRGEQLTKVCAVCHNFTKGGANKIGPDLWDVVGGPIGEGRGGYAFSSAIEKHKGQKWDPELLNEWLDSPQHFAPGTKMTFAGFPKEQDRADVIAYLQTLK